MKNYTYYIGFFSILCTLALIEYLVSPPLLYEGNKKLYEPERPDLSVDVKKSSLSAQGFIPNFSEAGMSHISFQSYEGDNLFHIIPLSPQKNGFRVMKSEYFQENEIKNKMKILVSYELFSTQPRTIISAYESIKSRLREEFSKSLESRIIENNQYGDKSFIIRLEEGQKTMYLVVAHRDRLLGFEYSIDDLGSRHEEIEKVLLQIFSH